MVRVVDVTSREKVPEPPQVFHAVVAYALKSKSDKEELEVQARKRFTPLRLLQQMTFLCRR